MEDSNPRFVELTRDYAALMAAAIRRVCGRRHGALVPDVTQEVHLALWKRLASGNEIRHPASYLYKVALTTALAMVRRLEPEAASLEEAREPRSEPLARDGVTLEPAEQALLIRQVLETLEAEQAGALRAWLAGFNHVEVAALFGWTESVARHRIYRGLERLRATLRERDGDS
jgi:RNA polymerase sigma factor (sigma-70 family)